MTYEYQKLGIFTRNPRFATVLLPFAQGILTQEYNNLGHFAF